jgi:hypothetical protein
VVNLDRLHRVSSIARGLMVDEADQASMRTLLKAQHRYAFDREERKLLSLESLALTTTASTTVFAPAIRGRL